jgi:hypothetical protein
MVFQEISNGSSSKKGIQKLAYILLKGWRFIGQEGYLIKLAIPFIAT